MQDYIYYTIMDTRRRHNFILIFMSHGDISDIYLQYKTMNYLQQNSIYFVRLFSQSTDFSYRMTSYFSINTHSRNISGRRNYHKIIWFIKKTVKQWMDVIVEFSIFGHIYIKKFFQGGNISLYKKGSHSSFWVNYGYIN